VLAKKEQLKERSMRKFFATITISTEYGTKSETAKFEEFTKTKLLKKLARLITGKETFVQIKIWRISGEESNPDSQR
jgi:hypothetical protein